MCLQTGCLVIVQFCDVFSCLSNPLCLVYLNNIYRFSNGIDSNIKTIYGKAVFVGLPCLGVPICISIRSSHRFSNAELTQITCGFAFSTYLMVSA